MNKYILGNRLDRTMIKARQAGDNLLRFPLFHAPGILTYRGALRLKEIYFGVEIVDETVKETRINLDRCPKVAYTAVVRVKFNGATRAGAGISQERDVAIGFAFRNAIKFLFTRKQMDLLNDYPHFDDCRCEDCAVDEGVGNLYGYGQA